MSVARRASLLKLSRLHAAALSSPKRRASSDPHHGDGDAHHDEYPPETFNTPIWRNTLIISVLAFGAYKFMPDDPWGYGDDQPFILRYLMHHLHTPPEVWHERNLKHLAQSVVAAEEKILFEHAEKPPVRRMIDPGIFYQASPYCVPVGSQIDLSDLIVKPTGS